MYFKIKCPFLIVYLMSHKGEFMIHGRYCKKMGCTVMEHGSVLLVDPFQRKKSNQLLERKQFYQNSMKPSQIQFWNIEQIETKVLKILLQRPRVYRYGHQNSLYWNGLLRPDWSDQFHSSKVLTLRNSQRTYSRGDSMISWAANQGMCDFDRVGSFVVT